MRIVGDIGSLGLVPGEVFSAVVGLSHPPEGETDPNFPSEFVMPRAYDWEGVAGYPVQPEKLWRGLIQDPVTLDIVCENQLSEWPGRAYNLAELRNFGAMKKNFVPVGTRVLMGVAYWPQLLTQEQINTGCLGLPVPNIGVGDGPLFFFDLYVDPESRYCECNPDNEDCSSWPEE